MKKKTRDLFLNEIGWKRFLRAVRRAKHKKKLRAALQQRTGNMRHKGKKKKSLVKPSENNAKQSALPLPASLKFLAAQPNLFSKKNIPKKETGELLIPHIFSLLDNYEESYDFLRRLFFALYRGKTEQLILDYRYCERIDVDASICMDTMLADFIAYSNTNKSVGIHLNPLRIRPIRFEREEIKEVLFSIGAYRNIKSVKIPYPAIEALPVLINDRTDPRVWEINEVHLTQIVDYIKCCLKRLGRDLTTEAETEFYRVIGEIMSNAEEHSTSAKRYAIGFFKETHNEESHFGIFNFTIFNYGNTIYQTFKSPLCKNPKAVAEMRDLSASYIKRGLFSKAAFEEETLWTLYALQQGVTSKETKRGNGSVAYIESFFSLKGDMAPSEESKLIIHSGHSRIIFDGRYGIIKKQKELDGRPFKMITFNQTGDISDKPDKKYVTFAPHYFPGTLVSARILISYNNTNAQNNGT